MFKNSKLFFWTIEILAVILIIFLLNQITFVFTPVSTLLGLLFIPFLISGFLFYVFHPVVHFMERKWHFKKIVAILLIVLALIAVFVIIIATVIPNVINQLTGLIASTPKMYSQTLSWVEGLSRNSQFSQLYKQVNGDQIINNLNISYTDVLKNVLNGLTFSLGNVVGVIAGIVLVVILVPILLFYMLNDGDKMLPHVRKHIL
ncbi:MAG: AI-2E family transporter, partial [Streptococcaceae bacterium]|nr:AI-2E family transporter [Streptococcaceae bacterium]